jgi:phage shock protein A
MALITRMTRLFTADLHAVLDRLEEPGVLLKQALREMEDDVALREQRIRYLEHEREESTQHADGLERDLVQLARQLDVCFASAAEDLARTLLKRKLEVEQLIKRLRARADAAAKALITETAQLEENRQVFDALRQKAEQLLDEGSSSPGRPSLYQPSITDADVEVALLQEKLRRSRS